MENMNKKPIFIVAFFTFLIALFFAIEQKEQADHFSPRLSRTAKDAEKTIAALEGGFHHKLLCPVKKGAKYATKAFLCPVKKTAKYAGKAVLCPVKKTAKFAHHHGQHLAHAVADRLPF